jgi:hypothetical protein
MLATTIAWDNAFSWTWEQAVDAVEATMTQVSAASHYHTFACLISSFFNYTILSNKPV